MQKEEERFYAAEYIRRRGIQGHATEGEHPDFVVSTPLGQVGIEVVSYGDSKGSRSRRCMGCATDSTAEFRQRNPDLNRFGARLCFRNYHMPPTRRYEQFCEAVAALLRKQVDLPARGKWRTVRINEADAVLGLHLSHIEVYGVTFYSDWEWPNLMNGGIGTSDEEMLAAIDRKLREYHEPSHIKESHLVVYGRGPQRTRIAAPFSAEQLDSFPSLERRA